MSAELKYEDYEKRIPPNKLEKKVDYGSKGVQLHLHMIAQEMDHWDTKVANLLGLKKLHIKDIKHEHSTLEGQRIACLQKWMDMCGSSATYKVLLDVFVKTENGDAAEVIVNVLGDKPVAGHPQAAALPQQQNQGRSQLGSSGSMPQLPKIKREQPAEITKHCDKYWQYIKHYNIGDQRYKLEAVVSDHEIVWLAKHLLTWETELPGLLKLTPTDISDIHSRISDREPLKKRRSALQIWKNNDRLNATFESLLDICLRGGDSKTAEEICVYIRDNVPEGSKVASKSKTVEQDSESESPAPEAKRSRIEQDSDEAEPPKKRSRLEPGIPEVFNEEFTVDQLHSWLLYKEQMPEEDCDIIRAKKINGVVFKGMLEDSAFDAFGVSKLAGVYTIKNIKKKIAPSAGTTANGNIQGKPEPTKVVTDDQWVPDLQHNAFNRGEHTPNLNLWLLPNKKSEENIVPEKFFQEPRSKYYKMDSAQHGVALIISNKFENSQHERKGGEIDELNLTQLFLYLGYRPVICRDLTKDDINDIFTDLDSKLNEWFPTHDSFVCCILSHGKEGKVQTSDHEFVEIAEIERKTGSSTLLDAKPKMFFIQTCRGNHPGTIIASDLSADTVKSNRADIYICYATVYGDKAYRDENKGSLFVSEVCRILYKSAKSIRLDDEFQKSLNDSVSSYRLSADECEIIQQSTCSHQLRLSIHFFYGYKD